MSSPQDPYAEALPDSALPTSGMASGTDAGEPGEHLGPDDLEPDELGLLAALERDAEPRGDDEEDPVTYVRAAEDDAPLPAQGGTQDDGLTPRFSSPGEA